jgi:hypothetical protein
MSAHDVFISYSRRDQVFARRLFDRIEQERLSGWADWEGIPYSAEWWAEIRKGIESAHSFVCVLSPAYITSRICNDELAYARQLNKRIIPVVRRELRQNGEFLPEIKVGLYGRPWAALAEENDRETARLNYIFCRKRPGFECQYDEVTRKVTNPECDGAASDADDFETAFGQLLETVRKDPLYIAEHTRLLTRAREWEQTKRAGKLLAGEDVLAAEIWLAGSEGREPPPTALHRQYIAASRRAATAQRRLVQGLVAGIVGAVMIVLAILAAPRLFAELARRSAVGVAQNISGLAVERTEVTNARYRLCVEYGPCGLPDVTFPVSQIPNPYFERAYDDLPVVGVNVLQALEFCEWTGRRLPTRAEWERVGSETLIPWPPGADWNPQSANLYYADEEDYHQLSTTGRAQPVGGSEAGGVADWIGNVSEWTLENAGQPIIGAVAAFDVQAIPKLEAFIVGGNYLMPPEALARNLIIPASLTSRRVDTGFRCVSEAS